MTIRRSSAYIYSPDAPEGPNVKIWLDVEQDPDGTLSYPSGNPLLTLINKKSISISSGLNSGECLYFDITASKYVKAPCEEEHYTICFIKKTPQIMEEKIFVENINDRINDLQYLKMHKDTKLILQTHLNQIERGSCPSRGASSLTKALGLDQPVNEFGKPERLDVNVYNQLVGHLQSDVDKFNNLIFNFKFTDKLKVMLGFSSDVKILYDKVRKSVCFFQKIKEKIEPDKISTAIARIETQLSSILSKANQTSHTQITNAMIKIRGELEEIKTSRPHIDKVMKLINDAFNAAKIFTNETSEAAKGSSNNKLEEVKKQLLRQFNQLVTSKVKEHASAFQKFVDDHTPLKIGDIEEVVQVKIGEELSSINNTIKDVIKHSDNIVNKDFVFFNFTMLDIILASSAATLALIALINSACLCKLCSMAKSGRKKKSDSYNDLELSPIVKKGLKFGKNKVKEFQDYSSIETLPSPEPTVRKSYVRS